MSSWTLRASGKGYPALSSMGLILGVDTGGTFTDIVCIDASGHTKRWKVLSTPHDPSQAIIQGITELLADFRSADIEMVHGTTVGTNAFLERKGAKVCLVTTRGFEDIIFIGRQNRPSLYDFMVAKPPPVIDRNAILGLMERTGPDGEIIQEPSQEELTRAATFCKEMGAESVAICLLHSYANPENERKATSYLAEKGFRTYASSEILPEFREFERTSTTMINAYLGPVVGDYVKRLEESLPGSRIFIQQSNGGCRPATAIDKFAVTTLLSGPAGGVAASLRLGQSLGFENIITFDMGGTSTDVSLCAGDFTYTKEYMIQGYPVGLPMIDIHTVGAGGGSIAWIDKGGLIKVGPESAGADPGPVCYGKGERITVTDANLYLGRLRASAFLGGRMRLAKDRVSRFMESFADKVGISPIEAALGIIKIVNVNMIQAIRAVSLERGFDPREFVLVSFGGAAGLHCLELAHELGINNVLIPETAGVFSATGMAGADLLFEGSTSLFVTSGKKTSSRLDRAFSSLEAKIKDSASIDREDSNAFHTERLIDARYKGQSFEITVRYGAGWEKDFHLQHKRLYGYCLYDTSIEITAIRSRLRLKRKLHEDTLTMEDKENSTISSGKDLLCCQKAQIIFDDGLKELPVIYRKGIVKDCRLSGPILIIDDFTTILVPEGWNIAKLSGHLLARKS